MGRDGVSDLFGSSHYPLAIERRLNEKVDSEGSPETRHVRVEAYGKIIDAMPALGYRPLPQALRFHKSKARIRLNVGGNRSSKSYSLVQETFWRLTNTHPYCSPEEQKDGITAWYATKSYELVGSTFWPSLERLLKGSWRYDVQWIKKQENIPRSVTVYTNTGAKSLLTFKAYEQGRETFQAAALDLAALDEQPPQDIWLEIITRIGSGKKLMIIAGFTPIIPQPWMEEKVNNPGPDTEVFNYPLDDNRVSLGGFIEDVEIDGMIAEWPEEVRETRRNGKWGSFVGTIFQSFSREAHVVNEVDEGQYLFFNGRRYSHLPPTWRAIGAIDWGGANPFVFLWGVRLPHMDDAWYIFDEYYHRPLKQGQKRLEEHAQEILRRTEDRWASSLARVWADHDPTNAFEMANYGLPSQPADKDVFAGIEHVQTLLMVRKDTGKPRLFIADRCVNLIDEIRSYRWAQGTDRRDAREEPQKINDHAVDACRYLVFSDREHASEPQRVVIDNPANRRRF
jgi:phage terminase large subunit-like protein